MADRYAYRVVWSEEDGEYVGLCAEHPGLSHLDPSAERAFAGIRALARDVVRDMAAAGDPVPGPLASQTYSGVFKVRIAPELHRRLALEAAERGTSLNRMVSTRLAASVAEAMAPLRLRPRAPHVAHVGGRMLGAAAPARAPRAARRA